MPCVHSHDIDNKEKKQDNKMGLSDPSPIMMSAAAASLAMIYMYLYKLKPKQVFKATYDYIVIGAGSAGCVVAARLSEDPDKSVLLLEAGPADDDHRIGVPAASPALQQSDVDWNFQIEPQEHACHGFRNNSIKWPRGKVLGGCSSVNGMVFMRGHAADYDSWESLGAEGWGWKDVLPYFLKCENNIIPSQASSPYHNIGGPVTISEPEFTFNMSWNFIKAGVELGFKEIDFNTGDNIGFGRIPTNITDKNERCNMAKAYLEPAKSRPNLTVVTGAHVTKIDIQNKKAVGVEFVLDGDEISVAVTGEVIVSAGAVGSPQILMLSGIGPKSHLEEVGIECIHDLPVGDNLQCGQNVCAIHCAKLNTVTDHAGVQVRGTVKQGSGVIKLGEIKSMANFVKYLTGFKSQLATNGVEASAFFKTNVEEDDIAWPDMQLHFIPTFYYTGADDEKFVPLSDEKFRSFFGQNESQSERMRKEGIAFLPTLLHPRSKGTIRLRSSNPLEAPVIDPRYFEDPHDVKVMAEGIRMCRRITETNVMKVQSAKIVNLQMPGSSEDEFSEANLTEYCRHFCGTVYHPVGTCKMGAIDDPTAVVDPQLRVQGIDSLRVIDASVMPHLTSGNTNAPSIMIGEKGADLLKDVVY